jgi:16S rRNA (adenine1518-N6/adenine1519-N6)-dimethyltransferase
MTKTELLRILDEENIHLRKKHGQNYLIDQNVLKSMLSKIQIQASDHCVEIGTGLGVLTEKLLATGAQVTSYETDRKVFEVVSRRLGIDPKLILHHEDFLKASWAQFQKPIRVIANPPYNISSSILVLLWMKKRVLQDFCLLLQKEVVERLVSKNPGKEMGFLSILLQMEFSLKLLKTVSRKAFFPEPKVDSAYLQGISNPSSLMEEESPAFFQFVKTGFAERRKQLLPRLAKIYPDAQNAFTVLGLSPHLRAESLPHAMWLILFRKIRSSAHE